MITIQFLSGFSKRENSTKRFSGTVDMSLQGILKEPCSIMTPVIQIERLENDINPCIYTYATISSFRRMYFVDDWVWVNGLWEVHLREDVLGTWKEAIGQQTEYILRTDSTTDFDENITDTIYPSTTDIDYEVTENTSPFSPASINSGCYIVGIISAGSSDSIGAITYYIMNSELFGNLRTALFSDNNLMTMGIIDAVGQMLVTDMSKEVLKTMYNPFQYIASCMWFPINPVDIVNKEAVSDINIGWWSYSLGGWRLTYPMVNLLENAMNLPNHSQSALRGNYLNYAPYTRRTLYGRFGTVPLDTACFINGDSIQVRYNIDMVTGQCRAIIERLRNNSIDFLAEKNFLVGVPIQIAQVGVDYIGAAATTISAGSQAAQKVLSFDYGGAVASLASGISSSLNSQMPQLETNGSNGSFLSTNINTKMVTTFYNIAEEDITHKGRPLCASRRINELDGFILCADGELDLNCLDNERAEINRYLTTGFFWE